MICNDVIVLLLSVCCLFYGFFIPLLFVCLFVVVLEPMIIFVMGYLSYILADMFEFSGIVRLAKIVDRLCNNTIDLAAE